MIVLFIPKEVFPEILLLASMMIWGLIVVLVVAIFSILIFKKKKEKRKEKILKSFRLLIEKALFDKSEHEEKSGKEVLLSGKMKKLLRKTVFRQWLVDELVRARKNLSGSAHEDIKNLYEQLALYEIALKKLSSIKWNWKVQGIQELCIMGQEQFIEKIAVFVEHENEDIRAEAQLALVHFKGFQGLDFLDTITKPISYWNRIRLLEEIASAIYQEFKEPEKWLCSTNDSVVLFALRLTGIYHIFNVHDAVIECMHHSNETVRIEALRTLEDVYNEATSAAIIDCYESGNLKFKMAALQTLSKVGSLDNLDFLLSVWKNNDPRIKLAAARAVLASAGDDGIETLKRATEANPMPYQIIFEQLKAEATL